MLSKIKIYSNETGKSVSDAPLLAGKLRSLDEKLKSLSLDVVSKKTFDRVVSELVKKEDLDPIIEQQKTTQQKKTTRELNQCTPGYCSGVAQLFEFID